ncbi:lamin tail domain-containing protein [Candidatus Woesearchaeota archaeon]|nr:lamin tail domain-containing protein [Candidatus Woesearchaeota archaeon]
MDKLALALFIIGIILTLASAVSGIRISEIMYDPVGNDYDYEFVELYSNESENISRFYFEGIDFQFPENTMIDGYLVVANTLSDFQIRYPNISVEFEYKGSLSNSGETLTLLNATGDIIDSISYEPIADEGYSLEYYNDSFIASNQLHGTPGSGYVVKEEPVSNDTNNTDSDNCDVSLDISLDKLIFQNNEKVKFKPIIFNDSLTTAGEITDIDYEIDYFIEDANNNVIRSLRTTTNTNTKTFTPDIDEMDKVFFINMQIRPECNDTNLDNNFAIKSFYVIKNTSLIPNIEIKKVNLGTDNKVKFGETAKATVSITRGNSSKKTVYLYIEDISERAKLNIDTKSETEFTIPVQLEPNCNDAFSDGLYDLIVEGFDLTVKTAVNVEGKVKSLCQGSNPENEEDKEEESKSTESAKTPIVIKSFYTRVRNFYVGRDIQIYAKIENKNFTDTYNVIFFEQTNQSNKTLSEQQILIKAGQTFPLNFSAKIGLKTANFGLKIARNQEVFDTKKIPIFLDFQDGELGSEAVEFGTLSESGNPQNKAPEKTKGLKVTNISQQQKEQQNNERGAVVFDNGESQRKSIVNYLIMGISVALNSLLIWKR